MITEYVTGVHYDKIYITFNHDRFPGAYLAHLEG